MGKRGPQPKRRAPILWTPKLAYVIGLITTDGCLSNDGRHLDITSKDTQLLKTVKQCLGLTVKIGKKSSTYNPTGHYFHIQFGDVVLYRWLQSIGLTPKKSKTIGILKIPHRYFRDFLRGHFDGDGSFYSYWDPRWHSSFMFYLQFVSASRHHLEWLKDTITTIFSVGGTIGPLRRGAHQLRFAKTASLKLLRAMYHHREIPYLERKYKKVIRALRQEDIIL